MNKIRDFGFKRGDTVICKKDVYNDNTLVFKSGQSYEVFSTHHFKLDSLIVILYDSNKKAGSSFTLLGNKEGQNGVFLKFGDYFYSKQELRKVKLQNLNK